MAEERTLGLARATEDLAEDPSKEELQRRMDEARDSISHTVTEIKETVANQVQAVKDTLDWREQFKKRPVAWSFGAAASGFALGYCIAAFVKGDAEDEDVFDLYSAQAQSHAAQPVIAVAPASAETERAFAKLTENGHDEGPGLIHKLSHSPAFGRVKDEVGNIGDAFLQELGKTAKLVVLPAVMTSIKKFLGSHLPAGSQTDSSRSASMSNEASRTKTENQSSYQPTLDRGHS